MTIAKYHRAYADLREAELRLLEATIEAWPIGMPVTSNKFYNRWINADGSTHESGYKIIGVIAGHHSYRDFGAVIVRNVKTGKTHCAWPHFVHNGVPGVEPR